MGGSAARACSGARSHGSAHRDQEGPATRGSAQDGQACLRDPAERRRFLLSDGARGLVQAPRQRLGSLTPAESERVARAGQCRSLSPNTYGTIPRRRAQFLHDAAPGTRGSASASRWRSRSSARATWRRFWTGSGTAFRPETMALSSALDHWSPFGSATIDSRCWMAAARTDLPGAMAAGRDDTMIYAGLGFAVAMLEKLVRARTGKDAGSDQQFAEIFIPGPVEDRGDRPSGRAGLGATEPRREPSLRRRLVRQRAAPPC